MTVKATDGAGYSGSASFTWTITNTVAVTSPGNQSTVSGTAITPVTNSATDTQSGATLTWSATGLPAGLSINASTGHDHGHADHGRHAPSVTVKATDGAGYSGRPRFTWTVTNTVAVDQPGQPVRRLGHGHHPGHQLGHRLLVDGHPDLVGHRPARRAVDQLVHRHDHGHADDARHLLGDRDGHRRERANGSATFSWTITNTVAVAGPGQPDATSRAPPSPRSTNSATDSQSGATLTWSATGLPAGLSINRLDRHHHRHADSAGHLLGDRQGH